MKVGTVDQMIVKQNAATIATKKRKIGELGLPERPQEQIKRRRPNEHSLCTKLCCGGRLAGTISPKHMTPKIASIGGFNDMLQRLSIQPKQSGTTILTTHKENTNTCLNTNSDA